MEHENIVALGREIDDFSTIYERNIAPIAGDDPAVMGKAVDYFLQMGKQIRAARANVSHDVLDRAVATRVNAHDGMAAMLVKHVRAAKMDSNAPQLMGAIRQFKTDSRTFWQDLLANSPDYSEGKGRI